MRVNMMMTWPQSRNCRFARELDLIRRFIQNTAKNLKRDQDELEAEFARETAGMDHNDAQDVWQSYGEDSFKLSNEFPSIHASMTFISLYSLMEHYLRDLCKVRQKECKFLISSDDLPGRGSIDSSFTYLTKVCGIVFPWPSQEEKAVKSYKRLRNVIVHNRGHLKKGEDKDIRDFAKSVPSLKVEFDELILSYQFCLEVITTLKEFMTQVTKSIPTDKQAVHIK